VKLHTRSCGEGERACARACSAADLEVQACGKLEPLSLRRLWLQRLGASNEAHGGGFVYGELVAEPERQLNLSRRQLV
jgi:hypothetical protein